MAEFEYQLNSIIYVEAPLFREGDINYKNKIYNSVADQILHPINKQDQAFLPFHQQSPKTCFQLQFKLILAEIHRPVQQILNIRSMMYNLISISIVNHDSISMSISKNNFVLKFTPFELHIMKNIYFSVYLTPDSEFFLLINGQQRTQKIESEEHLTDFYRQLYEMSKLYMQIGSRNLDQSFEGIVDTFSFKSLQKKDYQNIIEDQLKMQLSLVQKLNTQNAFQFQRIYSYPIKTLNQLNNWNNFRQELGIKPIQSNRNIRRNPNKSQVIICHDMENGYKEDCWTLGNSMEQLSYRFYHMVQCDIFIYFSHNLVTIPTQPYINVCHQFGVKCLGTLITEGKGGEELSKTLLSGNENNQFYYADKLIEICKFYGFDGYLINIENDIQDSEDLVKFMKYLGVKLKEEVPDSIIVYYDSIIHSGQLKHQSALNEENVRFFESADYFFTDYHWTNEKLVLSSSFAGPNNKRLFTGVDIWGRGQFGGGKENTHLAVNAIKEVDTSIALFAQAWTYETAKQKSDFQLKDKQFWEGMKSIDLYNKEKHSFTIEKNGGQGWQLYYDDTLQSEVAISSFEPCVRSFTVAIKQVLNKGLDELNGMISFSIKVKGTGPKFNDYYLSAIELFNAQYQIVGCIDSFRNQLMSSTFNINQMNQCSENWNDVKLTIVLDQLDYQTRKQVTYIKFTEIGKDQEFWAGNFGSQFSCESIQFIINDPSKDIIGKLGSRRFYDLPIQTYYNHAMGEHCYIDGNKYSPYKGFYNNLNDFDFMQCYPTKKINELKLTNCEPIELSNNYQTQIYVKEAWNGSSCLQIRGLLQSFQGTALKLLKTDINTNGNLTISLNVKNFDKNKNMISIILKFGNNKCLKYDPTKISLNNQWDSIQFTISSQNAIRGMYLLIRNLKNYQTNYDILLGGLGIYDDKLAEKIKQIVDFKDPARYIKGIQLCESLGNISNIISESILFDLYILFDFSEEIMKMIKTIRIFQQD